tara:strand:- start:5192 stop:5923 length:732 start_codon:yes stop_codon:yes gene_type:complete
MNKNIFIYWAQGFSNAPLTVLKCAESWKKNNPNWKIHFLDDNNLEKYINIKEHIPQIHKKTITKTSYSDIVRILLLHKYGGCWCDATVFCNKPLNNWLTKFHTESGFFAFKLNLKNTRIRPLSTWFLYAEPENYIIQEWKNAVIIYWNNNPKAHHYYWFHELFLLTSKKDSRFKDIWNKTNTLPAGPPHLPQRVGMFKDIKIISSHILNKIKSNLTPVYKLAYRPQYPSPKKKNLIGHILSIK